jgi:hypothetical protein
LSEFTRISTDDENAILTRAMLSALESFGGKMEIDVSAPIKAGLLISRTGQSTISITKIESGTIN